jgi:transposase
MQSQHCTTAEASVAAKTQTLIAGTPRCSRGPRQLFGGTQDCARRFHVMQKATTVTEKVRRGEHRPRMTDNYDSLNKAKYVRLTSFKNLTEKRRRLFDTTYARQLQTEKAWASKEMLRDLWGKITVASAITFPTTGTGR